jgi:hypothetical protein
MHRLYAWQQHPVFLRICAELLLLGFPNSNKVFFLFYGRIVISQCLFENTRWETVQKIVYGFSNIEFSRFFEIFCQILYYTSISRYKSYFNIFTAIHNPETRGWLMSTTRHNLLTFFKQCTVINFDHTTFYVRQFSSFKQPKDNISFWKHIISNMVYMIRKTAENYRLQHTGAS